MMTDEDCLGIVEAIRKPNEARIGVAIFKATIKLARDTTIDDCARVAEEMNHADETCYDIAREIRALKDKNPREE